MAGLFYLPRIYVYHSKEKVNTSSYKTFIVMERKLLKYIMNPSFVLTFLTGFILIIKIGEVQENGLFQNFF